MKITLLGNPVSVNALYSRSKHGVFIKKKYAELKKDWQMTALTERNKAKIFSPLTGRVDVVADIYFTNENIADIDNVCKLALDSLNKIIWEDDKQIYTLCLRKFEDKKNPRIELSVFTN